VWFLAIKCGGTEAQAAAFSIDAPTLRAVAALFRTVYLGENLRKLYSIYRSIVRRAWLAWSWTFIPLRELTQTLAEISHSSWLKTTIL
jgi:hypothetical protein